jgi:protein-tyrosine phosphatase
MTARQRLLPLVGAYNFRDLGGYPLAGGGHTRWGRLFRSDTLHELTEEDLAVLREVGLRSVIDLRTPTEVERLGRGRLEREPVHYTHLSVLRQEGGEQQGAPTFSDDIAERYLWYLEHGKVAFEQAFGLLGSESNYPLVFHCAAGKDRTGVLAALVLACVGVERLAVVDDYVLTATRMDLIRGRLRRDPLYGDKVDEIPPRMFAVEARTMDRFLELLDERYGGALAWALSIGVAPSQLDTLARQLVSPVS